MIVPPQSALPDMIGVPGVKTLPQLSVTEGTVGATTSAIQSTVAKQSGEALLVLTVKVDGGDGGPSDQTKVDKLTAVMSAAL